MGFLQRGLLIYLTIAIAVCLTMPSVIFDSGNAADRSVLSFFNMDLDNSTNTVSMRNTVTSSNVAEGTSGFTEITSAASSGSLFGFIDPIFQVWNWIKIFFKVIFSPIILLTSPAIVGAGVVSNALLFILGLPLVLMMIVALINWIRSGV